MGKAVPVAVAHRSLALRARDLAIAEGISIREAYSRLTRNARASRQRGPNGRFTKSGSVSMAINLSKLIRQASADFLVNVAVINSVLGDGYTDPNVESTYTETAQKRHIEQGLLTYAGAAKQQLRPPGESRQKQWMTQIMCDLVIDFMPEVDLTGDNVRFLVNGEEYAQKDTGDQLTDFYTRAGNQVLLRTVALIRTGRIEGRIVYTSSSVQADLYHYDLSAQKFSWVNPAAPAGVASIGQMNDGNLLDIYVANADGSDPSVVAVCGREWRGACGGHDPDRALHKRANAATRLLRRAKPGRVAVLERGALPAELHGLRGDADRAEG